MKKLIFLSTLLFTSAGFADLSCIHFGVDASLLYLQPNSSNLYYGAEAIPLPLPSPNWKSLEIRPNFHVGFDVGVKAYSEETGTGLRLNWERIHSSDSASTTVSPEDMVGPYFNIGPDAEAYKSAKGHVRHQFDAINLYFGKQFTFCGDATARFFAGVAFSRIKQTLRSSFSNLDETITRRVKAPSTFIGVGPGFGVDFAYSFCSNFSLVNEASLVFLTGWLKNDTTFLSTSPELEVLQITPPNRQTTEVPTRIQVVPGISEKLGFSYTGCWNQCAFSVDFGYLVQVYFNAIQSVDMSSEVRLKPVPSDVGVFALGFQRTLSNYFLTGPYFSVSIEY